MQSGKNACMARIDACIQYLEVREKIGVPVSSKFPLELLKADVNFTTKFTGAVSAIYMLPV